MTQLQQTIETIRTRISLPTIRQTVKTIALFGMFAAASRASLPDNLMPFAPALLGAAWITGMPVVALLGCLAGALMRSNWEAAVACGAFLVFAGALRLFCGKVYKRQAMVALAAAQLGSFIMLGIGTPYDSLMNGLGAVASVLLCSVYTNALQVFKTLRMRKLLSEEEIVALCVAAGTLLLGTADIEAAGISLCAVCAGIITLLLANTGGAGAGAASGVALGVMLAAGGRGEYVSVLGLGGVISGGFRRLGRWGGAVGYVLAAGVLTFYTRSDAVPLLNVAISAVLFMVLPRKVSEEVGRFVNASYRRERTRREYLHRLRELTAQRLREFSEAFAEMGSVFAQPLNRPNEHKWDITPLHMFCTGCQAENRCWMDEPRLREDFEQIVSGKEVPWRLVRCRQIEAITQAGEASLCGFRRENALRAKLEESRMMAGKQLRGVALVVDSLASKLDKDVRFDDVLEAQILSKLDTMGLRAQDVVAQFAGNRLSVTIEIKHCSQQCDKRIKSAITDACRRKMRLSKRECGSVCRATYEEARLLEVCAGIAQRSKGDCTTVGDTALAVALPDGRFLLALSDGMGAGEKAARESGAAISLLRRLYSAGVDRQATMEAVNRLLLLRGSDEMYSTIDACCIDLIDGHAELTKLGAAQSYWAHSEGIQLIRGESLPAGILEEAKEEVYCMILREGEWLIMMSDGVGDVLGTEGGALVSACLSGDPKSAALKLLDLAYSRGANDDMTVIAAQIVNGFGTPD